MRVPGRPRAGLEGDACTSNTRRLRRVEQRVDVVSWADQRPGRRESLGSGLATMARSQPGWHGALQCAEGLAGEVDNQMEGPDWRGLRISDLRRRPDLAVCAPGRRRGCHERRSGKRQILWRQSYPAPFEPVNSAAHHGKGPKSTPLFYEGRLYTFGISGILSSFDAATGKVEWRKEYTKDFKALGRNSGHLCRRSQAMGLSWR